MILTDEEIRIMNEAAVELDRGRRHQLITVTLLFLSILAAWAGSRPLVQLPCIGDIAHTPPAAQKQCHRTIDAGSDPALDSSLSPAETPADELFERAASSRPTTAGSLTQSR